MVVLAVLGVLVLVAIPLSFVWWRRSVHAALARELDVTVTRDPNKKPSAQGLSGPLARFIDVDQEVAAQLFPGVRLLSLRSYYDSLLPKGNVSLQGLLVSGLDRFGWRVALPLALFVPPSWCKDGEAGSLLARVSAAIGGLLSSTLTTLDLLALSSTAQRAHGFGSVASATLTADRVERARLGTKAALLAPDSSVPATPVQILVNGADPKTDDGLGQRLTSPFCLATDLLPLLNLTPDDLERTELETLPEPTPISPLLPDLFLGNGGLTLTASKGQAAVNKLIAMVLNRLAANAALPRKIDAAGHMTDQLRETFVVRLSNDADAASYTNVEDLVEALQRAGHEVKLGLGSNITSFGLGLCVKASDGNGWAHVPLGYPLSTGMWAAEDGRDLDVATLMSHASMQLQITGPLVGHCHLEWCLSLAGFTGWGSYTSVKRDWQTGPEVMTWHKDGGMDTPAGRRRALRLATVSSCTLNIAASRSAMLIGGYAFLGVCLDSVAAIQQAMTGSCSFYPLILGGDAKMSLLKTYSEIQHRARAAWGGGWEYAQEMEDMKTALVALPCDVVLEPTDVVYAAQRALACLPAKSPFSTVKTFRANLEAAIRCTQQLLPANA